LTPHTARHIFVGSNSEEYIQQIEEQDAGWEAVACSLAKFLAKAVPSAHEEAGELSTAILRLMTSGSYRQIARLINPPEPNDVFYKPSVEVLTQLIEERDRLHTQLEVVEKGVASMREQEFMEGMADIMEGTAVEPVRRMLANIEEQISKTQKAMEEQG
jgi:hypothetical protein